MGGPSFNSNNNMSQSSSMAFTASSSFPSSSSSSQFSSYGASPSSFKRQLSAHDMDLSKRKKMNDGSMNNSNAPSRVVHIRGLPGNVSEKTVYDLAASFGSVVRVLVLQAQCQAFVQMANLDQAAHMVSSYSNRQHQIAGKHIYCQFSSRHEVTLPNNSSSSNNNNNNNMNNNNNSLSSSSSNCATLTGGLLTAAQLESKDDMNPPSSVVLVTIRNSRVPISLDHIHQVFKPYGQVQKIVTFTKNNVFQALVQMDCTNSASAAKFHLEGKDMFSGCCHLHVAFSTLPELIVSSNTAKARDFTVNDPSWASMCNIPANIPQVQSQPITPKSVSSSSAPSSCYTSPLHTPTNRPHHSHSFSSSSQYSTSSQYSNPPTPTNANSSSSSPSSGSTGLSERGTVLLISNLPISISNPDSLFTLFGVYGDVLRVKVLFNKRDTALIQFSSSAQASLAAIHLNHLYMLDRELNVTISKHGEINLPRGGNDPESQEAALLTRDYTNSPIHRFKKGGSNHSKNISPPSSVLHIANIPDSAQESHLRVLFLKECNLSVVSIAFHPNSTRKQAYVVMQDIQSAVLALIHFHNYKMSDRYLRVSFSARDPQAIIDNDKRQSSAFSLDRHSSNQNHMNIIGNDNSYYSTTAPSSSLLQNSANSSPIPMPHRVFGHEIISNSVTIF